MSIVRRIATGAAAVAAALLVLSGTSAAAPTSANDDRAVKCEVTNHPTKKIYKNVWKPDAPTKRLPQNTSAGKMNQGSNYFYCQRNWGEKYRVTVGPWTNTWWALTDDDSGNRNVWLNVVYISGGENNKPEPGLPQHGK
ncbi:hypothetical protein SUDANB95_05009 [Actinosynnema sp. ALI-1.44]